MNATSTSGPGLSAELAKLGLAPITPPSAIKGIPDSAELPGTIPVSKIIAAKAEPDEDHLPVTMLRPPEPRAKLKVVRGRRLNAVFPLYEGANVVGRRDDRAVDVDLTDLEPPDRIWSSRRHAVITLTEDSIVIDDLQSLNGTFVNRNRIVPGEEQRLAIDDVVQIGTIQFKVII
jgi:hypothetical protein